SIVGAKGFTGSLAGGLDCDGHGRGPKCRNDVQPDCGCGLRRPESPDKWARLATGKPVDELCGGFYGCDVGTFYFFRLEAEFPVLLFIIPNAGNPAFILVH